MNLSKIGKGLWNVGKFLYEHPEALEVAAAATGHPGVAAGIATVAKAREAVQPPAAAPAPPPDAAPAPTPAGPPPGAVVPEVDLVGKWRGTLDRMAMEVLGHRMAEDELFNNAKLLEAGDVAGVRRNLDGKR